MVLPSGTIGYIKKSKSDKEYLQLSSLSEFLRQTPNYVSYYHSTALVCLLELEVKTFLLKTQLSSARRLRIQAIIGCPGNSLPKASSYSVRRCYGIFQGITVINSDNQV